MNRYAELKKISEERELTIAEEAEIIKILTSDADYKVSVTAPQVKQSNIKDWIEDLPMELIIQIIKLIVNYYKNKD